MREIRELNVGAYVVNAEAIFPGLGTVCARPRRRLPPDRLRPQLIRSGLRVESYQIYDQDEVQGINTAEDLAHGGVHPAEAALPAAPAGGTEPDRLRHRRLAGHHRRRLHDAQRAAARQALANDITRRGEEKHGVVDRLRPALPSRQAAEASAEVFAGNNIPVTLLTEDAPTPLITYATARLGGLWPGFHRQPQSARMEWAQGLPRRWLASCWTTRRARSRLRPTS